MKKFSYQTLPSLKRLLLTFICILMSHSISAAVYHVIDSDGKLVGAKNVLIGSTLYDVDFREGAYNQLFGSGSPGLDATTYEQAATFSQALLDQVLVDISNHPFDTRSELIYGCTDLYLCKIFTPIGIGLRYGYAEPIGYITGNSSQYGGYDWSEAGNFYGLSIDTTGVADTVYADWSLRTVAYVPPPSVPVPASAWFFITAIMGLVGMKNRSAIPYK